MSPQDFGVRRILSPYRLQGLDFSVADASSDEKLHCLPFNELGPASNHFDSPITTHGANPDKLTWR